MDKGSSQLFEKMAIEGHYCPLKRLTEDTWIHILSNDISNLILSKQHSPMLKDFESWHVFYHINLLILICHVTAKMTYFCNSKTP